MAASRVVKRPVDSITTSMPSSPQGSAFGSLSSKTAISRSPTWKPFVCQGDLDVEAAEGGVVTQKVRIHLARDEVVDGDDLDRPGFARACAGLFSRSRTDRTKFLPIRPKPLMPMRTPTSITPLAVAWSRAAHSPQGRNTLSHLPGTPQTPSRHEQSELGGESLRIMLPEAVISEVASDEPDFARQLADRQRRPGPPARRRPGPRAHAARRGAARRRSPAVSGTCSRRFAT